MLKKMKYTEPEMEIVVFENEDVIATSTPNDYFGEFIRQELGISVE